MPTQRVRGWCYLVLIGHMVYFSNSTSNVFVHDNQTRTNAVLWVLFLGGRWCIHHLHVCDRL